MWMSQKCTDKVVGGILAGWRYDISGLAAEMRGDYEAHFAECAHCRSRQRLHRTIDISLIVIATISAVLFLVAFLAVRHFSPRHALILEIVALGGFAFSTLMWVIVAIATPAPLVMVDAAKTGARRLHDRLPEKVRDRIPEELKQRIS
jgi:hypothetical protein